jgi:DnaK suppressor protein
MNDLKKRGAMPAPPRPRSAALEADEHEIPALTIEQLAELRHALEEQRTRLIAHIEERRGQERDPSREVGDEMDEASMEGTTSMTSKLIERDAKLLNEIDRALGKMHEGSYGMCEGTGEPIGYARLRLRPWARYSIAYQEELEREERTRGGP